MYLTGASAVEMGLLVYDGVVRSREEARREGGSRMRGEKTLLAADHVQAVRTMIK